MTTTSAATLHRQDGVALWRKVETALAEEIGRLPRDGERRLPTERELALRFGVNRHTIRQAVRALAGRGLVRTARGRGMFAADVLVDYPLGPRTRFSANLLAQDRAPSRRRLGCSVETADPVVARMLDLPEHSLVATIETLGLADGVPLCLSSLHLAAERFPGVEERLDDWPTVTSLLAGYGVADYRRRGTRVHARLPEAAEAALLRQTAVAPVLVTEALDVDANGRPLSFSVTRWAGDRVQFTVGN
jgi:GntR family transcriptional regulator, phosphonate transport system regulatory protein